MLNRIEQSLHFFDILFCTLLHHREHVDSANRLVLVAKKYDHVVFASNLHIVNRDWLLRQFTTFLSSFLSYRGCQCYAIYTAPHIYVVVAMDGLMCLTTLSKAAMPIVRSCYAQEMDLFQSDSFHNDLPLSSRHCWLMDQSSKQYFCTALTTP